LDLSVKNESFVTENITFTVAYSQTVIIPKPPMQRKPTTNQKIYRLVSEFEEKVEGHFFHTFDDHQLLDIISFYEKEKLIHKAIEAVDLALSQYKYRVDFYLLKVRSRIMSISKPMLPFKKQKAFLPLSLMSC
jgi:TPP-dependent indolepyruvate ferredoxin oxidoreductase alpha subunit